MLHFFCYNFHVTFCLITTIIIFQEELNKHNNEAETSHSVQKTQNHMPWKDDIYSQVKGPENRGRVRCLGNIPKPKKSKASLSENQELRDELKKMRESQERTNVFMENMMSVIQNRLSQEDLNVILQAARQVYYILLFGFIFRIL